MFTRNNQRGFTLIELIVTIVVTSIVMAGVMLGVNLITQHSADTLSRKQSLTIAESLLEQIEAQPFSNMNQTYINTMVNTVMSTPWLSGNTPSGAGYGASAALTTSGLGGIAGANAVGVTVTVTDPTGQLISLTGYRTNHS